MAGATWPVEISGFGEHICSPTEPGGRVTASPVRERETREVIGYVLCCPLCGELGHVHFEDGWTVAHDDGKLTLNPSVQCRCGGHYWLHDGVLKEA